jgi:hypothetical protein
MAAIGWKSGASKLNDYQIDMKRLSDSRPPFFVEAAKSMGKIAIAP